MTPSQCSLVHNTLSSCGLTPLTFTDDSFSNPGPHGKRTSFLLSIMPKPPSMVGQTMILTGNVILCQSQWESSGFISGKQLKDQQPLTNLTRGRDHRRDQAFFFSYTCSIFLSKESAVQKVEGWDKSPADLHSSRTGFCR